MALPVSFLNHLRTEGYHPRSDKHSNALARAIVHDFLETCPLAGERAAKGELVFDLNFDLIYGGSQWNVDLVLGAPAPPVMRPPDGAAIRQVSPSRVQIAIELKSVMTEHRKAIRNRKRDLEAHHEHVHNYDDRTIAGGVMVLNIAPTFWSPLRPPGVITKHRNVVALVEYCVNQLRNVTERNRLGVPGLDAKAALVVSMDNQNLATTTYHHRAPAPQIGDPIHYDAFIQRLCATYNDRFR